MDRDKTHHPYVEITQSRFTPKYEISELIQSYQDAVILLTSINGLSYYLPVLEAYSRFYEGSGFPLIPILAVIKKAIADGQLQTPYQIIYMPYNGGTQRCIYQFGRETSFSNSNDLLTVYTDEPGLSPEALLESYPPTTYTVGYIQALLFDPTRLGKGYTVTRSSMAFKWDKQIPRQTQPNFNSPRLFEDV